MLGGKKSEIMAFQVFPSLHSQVARTERNRQPRSSYRFIKFAVNRQLCNLVHKKPASNDTGIRHDAFILVQGRSGGHKLAVGMNYIHAKDENQDSLIVNMGQPIAYESVADHKVWGKASSSNSYSDLVWDNQKLTVDFYGEAKTKRNNDVEPLSDKGGVYVLNFDPGFLMPEEFMHIVNQFLERIKKARNYKGYPHPVGRVLFSTTAHLANRFPALDHDPLLLTALVRLLKSKEISLMIIGVEGEGRDDRVRGIGAMADVRITMHHFNDERLPTGLREGLNQHAARAAQSHEKEIRIVSSDNVTGKDYQKRYAFLDVDPNESRLEVTRLKDFGKNMKRSK